MGRMAQECDSLGGGVVGSHIGDWPPGPSEPRHSGNRILRAAKAGPWILQTSEEDDKDGELARRKGTLKPSRTSIGQWYPELFLFSSLLFFFLNGS